MWVGPGLSDEQVADGEGGASNKEDSRCKLIRSYGWLESGAQVEHQERVLGEQHILKGPGQPAN